MRNLFSKLHCLPFLFVATLCFSVNLQAASVLNCPLDSEGKLLDCADDDLDGVANYLDRCANSERDYVVDGQGCRETIKKAAALTVNVKFENDKSIIRPQFYSEVEKTADFLKRFPTVAVVIEGHTDSNASESYNQRLSMRRAKAVEALLISQYQIKAERISAIGYGELKPIATNATAQGRQKNRRIVAALQAEVALYTDRKRKVCPVAPQGVPTSCDGCPCDNDNDGVYNYLDRCPATPASYQVDEQGCRKSVKQLEALTLNVRFDNDQAVIKPQFFSELEKTVDFLNRYPSVVAVIEGHTDSNASDHYNQALSQRRANAVMKILIEKFDVAAARLSAVGYGETKPITTNATALGRETNRRIVAVLSAHSESAALWDETAQWVTLPQAFCPQVQAE